MSLSTVTIKTHDLPHLEPEVLALLVVVAPLPALLPGCHSLDPLECLHVSHLVRNAR